LILSQRLGRSTATSLHLSGQPGFGDTPIALDCSWGNTEYLGGFLGGEATKKAKFDDTALLLIDTSESREGIVKSDDIGALGLGEDEGFFENHSAVGAALGGVMMARVIDKNLAHEASSDGDKVGAVLGINGPVVNEAEVSLVD
jgi:hypothetical protein